jgi:2-dehydro-3-deoxyphosphogluconate aldolase / (4S)-4-hydroxy-2-oxoglutarate aldolase
MPLSNSWFDAHFEASPYMAIFRGLSRDRTLELAYSAWAAGIRLIEVPVQKPDDLDTLAALVSAARKNGHQVGAGTVLTMNQLNAVQDAGASFIVTPGFDEIIVSQAVELGMAPLPGVATATEISKAHALGLTWLKAFPAVTLGSTWIRQMHGPFPSVRFVATGGMNLQNAQDFIAAGARGIAVGSAVEELATLGDPNQVAARRRPW